MLSLIVVPFGQAWTTHKTKLSMEEARKILLQAALKYYRSFLNYQGDDPAIQDNPVYAEHWAGHRPVEVLVEEDQIVIRRVGSDD